MSRPFTGYVLIRLNRTRHNALIADAPQGQNDTNTEKSLGDYRTVSPVKALI